jgi:FOG: HEAT repeat
MRLSGLTVVLAVCIPLLAQSDEKERVRAVRDLGKQGSEAIPKLQSYLSDASLNVRIEAVKAIVEIGTQHSLDPLIQATRDNDPEIQIRATDGLVNFYLPGYVQTGLTARIRRAGDRISGMFTDTNDQVIDPYITPRPEVIEAIGKLARGGISMESRANAARAIGILRGKAAIPDLIEALRSKNDQVIYESLIALQKIRDPQAAPQITFLLRDLDEKIQIAAIETTGILRNEEALPALREAFQRARSKKIQRAALTAIAMIPKEENRDLYVKFFNDKDAEIRTAAAEGFGRLGNPNDLERLENAFNNERKTGPRLALAFAIVGVGKTEVSEFSALQYLINNLNSRAWRGVAQPYLIELSRKPEVRKALYPALQKGTREEKIGLAQILARTGDSETVPYLEKLSSDDDREVAQEGLRAVKTLKARL